MDLQHLKGGGTLEKDRVLKNPTEEDLKTKTLDELRTDNGKDVTVARSVILRDLSKGHKSNSIRLRNHHSKSNGIDLTWILLRIVLPLILLYIIYCLAMGIMYPEKEGFA